MHILILGPGDLGTRVLSALLQRPFRKRVTVGGRDLSATQRAVNLHRFTAMQYDCFDPVDAVQIDVRAIEQTAEALAKLKPDVIFNSMSIQSWRFITELPTAVFEHLDRAQYGPWLPLHLTPMHQLMQAVRMAGLPNARIVNAAYPDAVNPVLAKVGLAPTIGIGNVANIIPALRTAIGMLLSRAPQDVEVLFYAHHSLSHNIPRFGTAGDVPYVLKAYVDFQDVSTAFSHVDAFRLVGTTLKRQGGTAGQILTAGSALRVLDADSARIVHAPGPHGLPGGYAVRGAEVVVPAGCDLAGLVAVNEQGQIADGITRIDADGTVHFEPASVAIMDEVLGYRCEGMRLEESEARAAELRARFLELKARL